MVSGRVAQPRCGPCPRDYFQLLFCVRWMSPSTACAQPHRRRTRTYADHVSITI